MLKRLKNPKTIITLGSLIVLILIINGIEVDSEIIMITVKAICSIGIILGILNNSDTAGLDLPFINKK